MEERVISNEEEIKDFALYICEKLSSFKKNKAKVLLLEGDLGAGKTTFTKELAKCFGVEGTVNSPTFILRKDYASKHSHIKKIIHVDAYRFTHPKESRALRLEEELIDPSNLIIVEWPSKMNYLKSDITIFMEIVDENKRFVQIKYDFEE